MEGDSARRKAGLSLRDEPTPSEVYVHNSTEVNEVEDHKLNDYTFGFCTLFFEGGKGEGREGDVFVFQPHIACLENNSPYMNKILTVSTLVIIAMI